MEPNIHSRIKIEYDRRRKKAYEELEKRKTDLYALYPRLSEIDEEVSKAGLRYGKMLLTGSLSSGHAVQTLNELIESLKAEKAELLEKNGYPPDYLNPAFTCSKCSDTGMITSEAGGPDTVCVCYRQQLIDFIYDCSNLTLVGKDGFLSFCADYYPDAADEVRYGIKQSPRSQILEIKENCIEFIRNFTNSDAKNLLFSGPTGVGKTFLANCIAIELMNLGYSVLYQTAPALFNTIYEYRYKYGRDDVYENSVYKSILDTDLLIIDDLGTESPSATRYAELLNIIDTRYANDKRKPCKTIISTNIDLKKLFEYYDERVVSRIIGSFDIFRFAGDDIRRLKK